MKNLHKLMSLLLALIMLVGMVPVVAVPAAAAEVEPITGYYYGGDLLADGKLDENTWIMRDRVGSTPITLLCQDERLFIGLYTEQTTAEFTVNNVLVTVDFDAGSAMVNGERVGAAACDAEFKSAEVEFPLSAVGLEYIRGQKVPFAAKIGTDSYTGTVVLAERSIAVGEHFDNIASRPYYTKSASADTAEVYIAQAEGAIHYKTNTMTDDGKTVYAPQYIMGSEFNTAKGYTVSFTADFNDLVVPFNKPGLLALSGFSVDVRSSVYCRHSFFSDAEGNLLVSLYDTIADKVFDTGLDLPAKNVAVEIVVKDDFESEVFINGESVGQFRASERTASGSYYGFVSGTVRRDLTATRKNDVVVYDMLFTQEGPTAKFVAGQLSDSKALVLDGDAGDMLWTMRDIVPGTQIGALCDEETLYLALNTQESAVDFTIMGQPATAKLGKKPTFALGYTMGSTIKGNGKGQYELSMPLSLLRLENPIGKTLDFAVTVSGQTREYSLVLGGGNKLELLVRKPAAGDGKNDALAYLDAAGLKFDGLLKENQWYTPYKAAGPDGAPAADIGFQWNGTALFVGGQVFDTARPDSVKLTLGGKTVTAQLAAATADVGDIKTSGQTFEWRIPVADLGITAPLNMKKDYRVDVTRGDKTSVLYGTLEFSGQVVVWGDTCRDFNTKDYTVQTTSSHTKWLNGENGYELVTLPGLDPKANQFCQHYTMLDYEGGAYEFTIDMNIKNIGTIDSSKVSSYGWREFCIEIRQPKLQTRYAFRNNGKGELLLETPYYYHNESHLTGIRLGERAKVTIKVSENRIPSLYVNDEFVLAMSRLDREQFTITDSIPMPRLILQSLNYDRIPNEDGTVGEMDAEIYTMLWTQTLYADNDAVVAAAADILTDKALLGGENPEDVTRLRLPTEVIAPDVGAACQVKWTAIDTATGMVAKNVNVTTGAITRPEETMLLNLTAQISCGGASTTRSYQFQVKGQPKVGKVAMIQNDLNPTTGVATDWSDNSYRYFDTLQNSIVIDQGSSKHFTTIKLYDSDEVSRVAQQHLGVFISNDGKTFTKVLGWYLRQDGKEYTLYNLNETARYIKVHTYHDDWAVSDFEPSFYNAIHKMATVSDEALPGVAGTFAHSADYVVKNTTGKDQRDYTVLITAAQLGAKAGQYKDSFVDFRFTMGNQILPYWYNGKDGFYVRVPSIAANGSATIKAQWGNGSAKDFSDATSVFEVSYGNVAVIPMHILTEMSTYGRPWLFPNGDFVVVGRRASTSLDLGIFRSTDGGHTFSEKAQLAYEDAKYPGYGSAFGGFMYNPYTGRLYLLAYRGNNKDTTKKDYRMMLLHSDDQGETWSEPLFLSSPYSEPWGGNETFYEYYPEGHNRNFLYGDGLTLNCYDGDGPNVDYVFSMVDSNYNTNPQSHNCLVVYSKDDGKHWSVSKDIIQIPVDTSRAHGLEDGVSESTLSQLSNGDLYLVVRTQQYGNNYLWSATSKDHGLTWEQGYSKIISSNTSPCLYQYGDTRLLLWSTCTGAGATSYQRTPMHLGYTTDDYQSFEKIVDLTFGTSLDTVDPAESRMTQPGIAVSEDGNTALVAYFDHFWKLRDESFEQGINPSQSALTGTMAFRVDQFDDVIRYNKGAYDDFEVAKLKYQGWLVNVGHSIQLTDEQSVSGMYSMKVVDATAAEAAHSLRQVPSMKYGTVGAKVMVPSTNKSDYALELKSAFNYDPMYLTLAAVAISPDGTVSVCSTSGKQAVAKVQPDTWNDIAISFDIAKDMGKLTINGKVVADVPLITDRSMTVIEKTGNVTYELEDVMREVTCVQFMQTEATSEMGDYLYVDDFYANDLTEALNRSTYEIGFADVKQGDWYFDAVNFAVSNGVMSGYNASKFGPNDTLTRAMVVQVLYNKEGQPNLNGLKHSFSDVPASQWYNNAVTWGSNRGVVSGYGGGVFKPEDAVTIEQVAVILWNYSNTPAGFGALNGIGSYSDWAANALKWAVDKGILDNVPFTNATEKATRAQTAQMLTNFLRGN